MLADSQVVMYGANCVGFVLAGSYSTNVTYTATAFVQAAPSLGYFDTGNDTTYADIYHYGGDSALGTKPTWWEDWISIDYMRGAASYDTCTYELCGGQAIHETVMAMPISGFVGTWPDQPTFTTPSIDFPAQELAVRGIYPSLFAGAGVSLGYGNDSFSDIADYISSYSSSVLSPRIVIKPEAEN